MTAFVAQYRGTCGDCLEPIEKGDQVVYVNDVLVHVDCEGDALVTVLQAEKTCGTCWMVGSGCQCDDGGTAA